MPERAAFLARGYAATTREPPALQLDSALGRATIEFRQERVNAERVRRPGL